MLGNSFPEIFPRVLFTLEKNQYLLHYTITQDPYFFVSDEVGKSQAPWFCSFGQVT